MERVLCRIAQLSDENHCAALAETTVAPAVKNQWNFVLNDIEELGDKEFLVQTDQYNFEKKCCFRLALP